MNAFKIFLRITAPIFLLVGALHLFFGVRADVLLGAKIPLEVITDPALDSQNRFIVVLLLSELAMPPVVLWWLSRVLVEITPQRSL